MNAFTEQLTNSGRNTVLAIQLSNEGTPEVHFTKQRPILLSQFITPFDVQTGLNFASLDQLAKRINTLLAEIPAKEVLLRRNGIYYTLSKIRFNPASEDRPIQCAVFVREFTTRRYSMPLSAANECELFGLTQKARDILWRISMTSQTVYYRQAVHVVDESRDSSPQHREFLQKFTATQN
jgi:hypothetical protein